MPSDGFLKEERNGIERVKMLMLLRLLDSVRVNNSRWLLFKNGMMLPDSWMRCL
jgi:hypothetical protein